MRSNLNITVTDIVPFTVHKKTGRKRPGLNARTKVSTSERWRRRTCSEIMRLKVISLRIFRDRLQEHVRCGKTLTSITRALEIGGNCPMRCSRLLAKSQISGLTSEDRVNVRGCVRFIEVLCCSYNLQVRFVLLLQQ